ncbi:rCG44455 [Rattus norvegicus]|uniref:RCG44455 n=1 Tax=Rattus norvegicus TaxID=10116 RepID=A6I4S6_RAT|nr:rCG44455 [Rattus norvegicus]
MGIGCSEVHSCKRVAVYKEALKTDSYSVHQNLSLRLVYSLMPPKDIRKQPSVQGSSQKHSLGNEGFKYPCRL